jgi:digeranylgeranylglycerophospholipid reductase
MIAHEKAHPTQRREGEPLRVAIVGAGLAGLSCAYELERLGVLPVIFERQGAVGRPGLMVETMPQFLHHNPREDIFDYIRRDLGLPIAPHAAIRRLSLYSSRTTALLSGHLGYATMRGQGDHSLERQLLRHIVARVEFGQQPDLWELRRSFDWVVLATGTHESAEQFTRFTPGITWSLRGAVVEGDFDPTEQRLFLNTRYAGTGHGVITPSSEEQAVAAVWVPGVTGAEAELLWQAFQQSVGHLWRRVLQPIPVERLEIGLPVRQVVGNMVLVGHAGGFCEPLGITGQCPSLASGVFAARQIALGDRSLDRFARQFRAHYNRCWRLRRNLNAWTDDEMDGLVRAVHLTGHLATNAIPNILTPGAWLIDGLRLDDNPSPEPGHP